MIAVIPTAATTNIVAGGIGNSVAAAGAVTAATRTKTASADSDIASLRWIGSPISYTTSARGSSGSPKRMGRTVYLSGSRWEAIFTTCVWSSVNHASTRMASASEHPALTAVSCVGDVACGALGMTLISCSRTALECETRTSPGFRFDNDWGLVSCDTTSVWIVLAIRAVPFST